MRSIKLVFAGVMIGVIAVCIYMSATMKNGNLDGDRHQKELMHRIASLPKSIQTSECRVEKLVDDICAVSNQDVQVALLKFLAKNAKAISCDSPNLQSRCRELSKCRLLTEKTCDGFRKVLGYSPEMWDLRFSMLARYVNATNECHKGWEGVDKRENGQKEAASGALPFLSSGQRAAGWLKSIEGDLDHYLVEISKWHYRVDSCSLSLEDRAKIKAAIEQISGRKLAFVEPQ
jgi:hypothetical protein